MSLSLAVLPLFAAAAAAPPQERPAPTVVAGPLVGHVAPDHARIWVQGSGPGWIVVEVSANGRTWSRSTAPNGRELRAWFDEERDHATVYEVQGLTPRTRYLYRLLNRDGELAAASEQSFVTPPPPGAAESFTVAFGSCAGDWGPDPTQPIFRAVDALHPEVFLWLGDNVYYSRDAQEWNDPSLMRARWRAQRALPNLQPLLRRSAHYAVWDDHDYGPDNSDKLYPLRDQAFALFTWYWANPAYGSSGERGVWHRFQRGRVEFFLLDGRYHRDPDWQEATPDKTQLGEAQWRWLEAGLRASTADFKILASATQVLSDYHRFESWKLYPGDRRRLLELIGAARIGGVVILSGDRHIGEMLRWEPPAAPYPLVEFTSSPLAAGIGTFTPDAEAPERLPGSGVAAENFGVLRFDFERDDPLLLLSARGVDGRVLYPEVALRLSELQIQ